MTGNLYVLLSLAEGIVSFLPAVGTAAARGSKSVVRRTSHLRAVLVDRMSATVRGIRVGRGRTDAGPNTAVEGEALTT